MSASDTKKKPKKLNALDWVIISLVILLVSGGIYYFGYVRSVSGDAVEISFTVEFRGVVTGGLESFIDLPQVGDEIFDSVKGYYLGVITGLRNEPTTAFTWNQLEERFEEPEYPDEYNMYVTITVDGIENDAVITTGEVDLRVGKEMYIKGKGYASPGYITAISTGKKGE